jgi:hypothetical protein
MLVRGVDTYHHFELETVPQAPFDPQAIASHAHAVDALMSLVYPSAPKDKVEN